MPFEHGIQFYQIQKEYCLLERKGTKNSLFTRSNSFTAFAALSVIYWPFRQLPRKSYALISLVQPTKKHATVKAAKARGEEINESVPVPEQPRLAFVLDTTIEALIHEKSPTAERILQCPVIMIECSYLEDSKEQEAVKRGHVWWGGLLPFIVRWAGHGKTWVLVHFSLRYSDEAILGFFEDPNTSRVNLTDKDPSRPPDVVLWLDAGPRELWIESFVETSNFPLDKCQSTR